MSEEANVGLLAVAAAVSDKHAWHFHHHHHSLQPLSSLPCLSLEFFFFLQPHFPFLFLCLTFFILLPQLFSYVLLLQNFHRDSFFYSSSLDWIWVVLQSYFPLHLQVISVSIFKP